MFQYLNRIKAFIFICIYVCLCFYAIQAKAVSYSEKTYIPPQAVDYYKLVVDNSDILMPDFSIPYYFSALMEHESCISLTHSRCLRANSTLSTKRELGVGLGQITKAFKADGTIRFDTLQSLHRKYPKELGELSWENVAKRTDLQITAIILLYRDGYKGLYKVANEFERAAMADSIYNGGKRDLDSSRRVCGMTQSCNPGLWFGHVERYCQKSKAALYGKRSACDINTHHVKNVMKDKLPKYKTDYERRGLID